MQQPCKRFILCLLLKSLRHGGVVGDIGRRGCLPTGQLVKLVVRVVIRAGQRRSRGIFVVEAQTSQIQGEGKFIIT